MLDAFFPGIPGTTPSFEPRNRSHLGIPLTEPLPGQGWHPTETIPAAKVGDTSTFEKKKPLQSTKTSDRSVPFARKLDRSSQSVPFAPFANDSPAFLFRRVSGRQGCVGHRITQSLSPASKPSRQRQEVNSQAFYTPGLPIAPTLRTTSVVQDRVASGPAASFSARAKSTFQSEQDKRAAVTIPVDFNPWFPCPKPAECG